VTGYCGGMGPLRNERRDVQSTELGKEDDGGTPGPARTLSGNRSRPAALRKEQREQLDSNHRENRAKGKECEADHRRHKHSPQKRRNGGMSVGYSGRITLRREQCGM
jgi:hypothetical protein